jgi:alpha-N-acetylglucosamine transferase
MDNIIKFTKHLQSLNKSDGYIIDAGCFSIRHTITALLHSINSRNNFIGYCNVDGVQSITPSDKNADNTYTFKNGHKKSDYNLLVNNIEKATKKPLQKNMIFTNKTIFLDKIKKLDNAINFIIIDFATYFDNRDILSLLWTRMAYGGVIFFRNYSPIYAGAVKALNEFMYEHSDEIISSRQMMVNGNKESDLVIKCFNPMFKPESPQGESSQDRTVNVFSVLKTGGLYNAEYVNKLASGIKSNTSYKVCFSCLTDNPNGLDTSLVDKIIPLKHNFPKWWSKIELFNPEITTDDQNFFFDLDTIIVGNLDEIFDFSEGFCGLRDFYHLVNLGSGVLSWKTDHNSIKIYRDFLKKSDYIIKHYSEGDQRWIEEIISNKNLLYWQDYFPKKFISFKKDCLKPDSSIEIPQNSSVLCFHGEPRIHILAKSNTLISSIWK